jgi:hypothetical protein
MLWRFVRPAASGTSAPLGRAHPAKAGNFWAYDVLTLILIPRRRLDNRIIIMVAPFV